MTDIRRHSILLWLSFAGFFVSGAAGLADHWMWLQLLCAGFAGSCKEAAQFSLLGLPLWGWGILYYTLLAVSIYRLPKWLPWLVSSAIGFEIALVWIAVSSRLYCTFCMGNFLVVLLLALISFDKKRFWQTLAVSSVVFLFSIFLVPQGHVLPAFTAAEKHHSNIVAKVAGTVITDKELETPIASRIYDLEKQIYQTKRQRLEKLLAEKALEEEARRRKITSKQLVNDEVLSKGIEVSDEEVDRYLLENRNRLQNQSGSTTDLRRRIKVFLEHRKSYEKVMQYAKSLEGQYGVTVFLKGPRPPHVKVDVQGNQALGPVNAPVTIVEFSDYQCPVCRRSHQVVRKIREMFRGRIRWIFKDYPLSMHKYAEKAAEAGRCAAEQGKFWEYQDALFAADGELTQTRLHDYAVKLGLDADRFEQCLERGTYQKQVEQDIAEGKKVGVEGTPTFMINGRLISGYIALERFKTMIDEELKKAKSGAKVERSY
jgi:protein-disulfide isomerase